MESEKKSEKAESKNDENVEEDKSLQNDEHIEKSNASNRLRQIADVVHKYFQSLEYRRVVAGNTAGTSRSNEHVRVQEVMRILVTYENKKYDVYCDLESTISDLKFVVSSLTKVPTYRQEYNHFYIAIRGRAESCKLKDLGVRPNCFLKMVDILAEPEPSCSSKSEVLASKKPLHYRNQLEPDRKKIKQVGIPRKGKKLLVIDLNQTIYDYNKETQKHSARPYAHEFLTEMYKHYDLGIWSASEMDILEQRIRYLGMKGNPNYKFLFYCDISATALLERNFQTNQVKPLDLIWENYSQYNPKNTLMIDDREESFYLNPRNGIVVSTYYCEDHQLDNELLKLTTYLKQMAKLKDVTEVRHKNWKSFKIPENPRKRK